ncbi:MAG: hypothetical protein IPI35_02670 [Deltaproteobacteria bacterium]|nr:hypothetical protein [Deltaproteobacteria bacterium]
MKDFTGLSSLQDVRDQLDVSDNSSLTSMAGFEALSSVGSLNVYDNPKLESIDGLESLSSIEHDVNIYNNDKLRSLVKPRRPLLLLGMTS